MVIVLDELFSVFEVAKHFEDLSTEIETSTYERLPLSTNYVFLQRIALTQHGYT